jgi:hypothetical protein
VSVWNAMIPWWAGASHRAHAGRITRATSGGGEHLLQEVCRRPSDRSMSLPGIITRTILGLSPAPVPAAHAFMPTSPLVAPNPGSSGCTGAPGVGNRRRHRRSSPAVLRPHQAGDRGVPVVVRADSSDERSSRATLTSPLQSDAQSF